MATSSRTTTRSPAKRATDAKAAPAAVEDVTLDLDDLERENPTQPFTFLHAGHLYTLLDPEEMDWQDQMRAFSDPLFFLRNNMSPKDAEKFFATKMPAWKLNAVMKAFRKHFGMPVLGE